MYYYIIRKAAAAANDSRMICDNWVGAKFPKYRTRREAEAEVKRIGGEALGEGYKVESLADWRNGRNKIRGLRFNDCIARYMIDIFRVDADQIRRCEGLKPEDMNVRPAGKWEVSALNQKFV